MIVSIGYVIFYYFGFRGWVEGICLMMEDFEILYVEINFLKDEWFVIKEKGIEIGLLMFG